MITNKHYIFITSDIHPIGGMQSYVLGKSMFLEDQGWNVHILFPGKKHGVCKYEYLNKFVSGGFFELALPPYARPRFRRKNIIKNILKNLDISDNSFTIVESHTDWASQWGELLAYRLNAKHVCFLCTEIFRGKKKCYDACLDFYDFKYGRDEIYGICDQTIPRLFDGYKAIEENPKYTFFAAPSDPVQDVDNDAVLKIKEGFDWTICYIGRAAKEYVPKVVEGVADFCHKYPDKNIQFVFVGDATCRKEFLDRLFSPIGNVSLVFMGDMSPIPRSIFSKLDVVIAGSGCAICSVYEDVPTILADAEKHMSNGLLGYDTIEFLYHDGVTEQTTFDIALENVLVKDLYKNKEFKMPPKISPDFYYAKQLDVVLGLNDNSAYYSEENICRKSPDFKKIVKSYISYNCPKIMKLLRRL